MNYTREEVMVGITKEKCIHVIWNTADGRQRTDYFMTPEYAERWWKVERPSYVHVHNSVRCGIIRFLAHIPLVDVRIVVYE